MLKRFLATLRPWLTGLAVPMALAASSPRVVAQPEECPYLETKLLPGDLEQGDQLGISVAISGLSDLTEVKLTAENPAERDLFGLGQVAP